jgi:hypothetical protein
LPQASYLAEEAPIPALSERQERLYGDVTLRKRAELDVVVPYEFIGSSHVSHDLPARAGVAGKTRNTGSLWPCRWATCLVRLGRSALTFAEYPADEGNRLVARVVNGAGKVRAE